MELKMSTYSIEKLNHDNYDQWSRDMKYVLMERGLWKIVNGTEKAPKDAVPKTGTVESPELSKAILDYETRSNIAVSLIYLNIETSYRKIVENCEDPVTIWTELRRQFMPDSRSHHMRLFSELVECRILPDESIGLFSARLTRIYSQIKSLDSNFSECYLSYQMLRYLPISYDGIVQNILRWKIDDFIYKDIVTELIAEESRLSLRNNDSFACHIYTDKSAKQGSSYRSSTPRAQQHYSPRSRRMSCQRKSRGTRRKSTDGLKEHRSPSPNRSVSRGRNYRRQNEQRPRMDITGATFSGGGGEVKIKEYNKTLFKAILRNGIYFVTPKVIKSKPKRVTFAAPVEVDEELSLWHKRLSHHSGAVMGAKPDLSYEFSIPSSINLNPNYIVEERCTRNVQESSDSQLSDLTSDDSALNLRRVKWLRKPKTRADGSRTDIYFFNKGVINV
ncbi:unnamed protein product [Larinioides sclopetarius]|uniref:DUF4219 domain-containing protein n=1 Tax=Larinioides sclopetarius TaxID=280406 RepID=A0AAV2B4H8_9ARAC